MRICLAILATCVVLGGSGYRIEGAAADPLPVTFLSPANGASVAPFGLLRFEFTTSPLPAGSSLGNVFADISTGDAVGEYGELLPSARVDLFQLRETSAGSNTFSGSTERISPPVGSLNRITYYWQIRAGRIDTGGPCPPCLSAREELSPVFTLTVAPTIGTLRPAPGESTEPSGTGPPAAAALTLAQSYADVKSVIARETGHPAHRLRESCRREDAASVSCQVRWTSTRPLSSRTRVYAGTMRLSVATGALHFSFVGLASREACVHRLGMRHCALHVHWAA